MADGSPRRVDEDAARAHFNTALEGHAQAFETFFFARFLGLSFDYLPHEAPDAEKEVCRLTFEVTDLLKNPQGSLHGGAMASAMDISMGHLVNKVAGPGATIEMKVQFMRPVTEGVVTCEGRFTRRGRTMSFMESRLTGPDGKLAALATATWKMPKI
ncbi:MAG: PaaI family thioesterase [Roseicyclus sp.]